MKLRINATNSREITESHPEGLFQAKCVSVTLAKTKTDKDILHFNFVTARGNLQNSSLFNGSDDNNFLIHQLKALGFDNLIGKDFDFEFDNCIGKVCIIRVIHEQREWNGKLINTHKIQGVYPINFPGLETMNIVTLSGNSTNQSSNSSITNNAVTYDSETEIPF